MGGRKLDKDDAGDSKNMPNVCQANPPVKDMSCAFLEWLGRPLKYPLSACTSRWAERRTGFQAEAKVGLRISRRHRPLWRNRGGWQSLVSSNAGYVYSLDAETGCIHWSFHSASVVRSGVTVGPMKPGSAKLAAFFGDIHGNAYALDAIEWRTALEKLDRLAAFGSGHRQSAAVIRADCISRSRRSRKTKSRTPNHVCCTFRGVVAALDADDR